MAAKEGKPVNLALIACGALILIGGIMFVVLSVQIGDLTDKQAKTEAQLASLQGNYTALNNEKQSLDATLADTEARLNAANARIFKLQNDLENKENELAASTQSLEEQEAAVETIQSDLDSLDRKISDSMSWFTDNAVFPSNYNSKSSVFHARVMDDCVDNGYLNLACVQYLMENSAFAIHYQTDIKTTGKADFLQSVRQTIDLGWGDCEDYAVLFRSILNMAKNEQGNLHAEAWDYGGDANFRIYPKAGEEYFYFPGAQGLDLGRLGGSYFYVVCYTHDSQSGHCVVAATPYAVTGSNEMGNLYGAYMFEPQSGKYMGQIGDAIFLCDRAGCTQQIGAISTVISDDDLYSYGSRGWEGYQDFAKRIKDAEGLLPA